MKVKRTCTFLFDEYEISTIRAAIGFLGNINDDDYNEMLAQADAEDFFDDLLNVLVFMEKNKSEN